jgi:hypothetical protein
MHSGYNATRRIEWMIDNIASEPKDTGCFVVTSRNIEGCSTW